MVGTKTPVGIAERKGRQRADREQRIVATARVIAEAEGWSAVTIRRLADEIEHSQPVLYSHFENRDAIIAAVAVEGFRDLGDALRQAARQPTPPLGATESAATAYLAFAQEHPAVYEAMFTLPISLRFAEADTKPELREAFEALAAVVGLPTSDAETLTETFWAALHGLAELERSGRVRQNARAERLSLLVRGLLGD